MIKNIITLIILIAAVTLMLQLGFWQLQRLEWKEGILAKIDAQEAIVAAETPLDLDDIVEYQRGYIDARFIGPALEVAPRVHKGAVGKHIYILVETKDGKGLLVNEGWLPSEEEFRYADLYPGRFIGHIRYPDAPNDFTPQNRPNDDLWYWVDIDAVSNQYPSISEFYPFILYSEFAMPAGNAIPFKGLPRPRNNHHQYAIFWFTMAGLLVALSGFYAWRIRRP